MPLPTGARLYAYKVGKPSQKRSELQPEPLLRKTRLFAEKGMRSHDDVMIQNWKSLFLAEKRWLTQVKEEVSKREVWNPPHTSDSRRRIWRGILSALCFNFWRKASDKVVFVGFGHDPLASEVDRIRPNSTVMAENKGKYLLRGQSLCELDALYHLINYPECLDRRIRKLFLFILIKWLKKTIPHLQNNLFLVKQDYYEKSSIIVTLSFIFPLRIIGIQHGLLIHQYLRKTNIYPGIRTPIEAVYSQTYKDILKEKKNPDAQLMIIGSPFDQGVKASLKSGQKSLVFVSSDDLKSPQSLLAIRSIQKAAEQIGIAFSVRPHPAEAAQTSLYNLPFRQETKDSLFSSNTDELILIGFYSTLLYEAGQKGFKTIWVTRNQKDNPADEFPEADDLKNALFTNQEEITSNWLDAVFGEPPEPIPESRFSFRLVQLLDQIQSKA